MPTEAPSVIVLAGPNGAGKSTMAAKLVTEVSDVAPFVAQFVDADVIARGYEFHLVFLRLPSPDLAVTRVAQRVRVGGHDVPEATIRRRYRSGLRNFFELYRPLTTTWRMYDNALGRPRLIASGAKARVLSVNDPESWNRILVEVERGD